MIINWENFIGLLAVLAIATEGIAYADTPSVAAPTAMTYTVTLVADPHPTGPQDFMVRPISMSANGDILGKCKDLSYRVWHDGKLYSLGTLAEMPAATTRCNPYAMNAIGQVVGDCTNSSTTTGDTHKMAFVWDRKHGMEAIGPPGDVWSSAKAINDKGDILLITKNQPNLQKAGDWQFLLWKKGKTTSVDLPQDCVHSPLLLDNRDQVIGSTTDDIICWDAGAIKKEAVLPLNHSELRQTIDSLQVTEINDDGTIVGWQGNMDWKEGVSMPAAIVCQGAGSIAALPLLTTQAAAYGINQVGQIVGESGDPFDVPDPITNCNLGTAVLWENGQIVNLNSCLPTGPYHTGHPYNLRCACNINDRGQIACVGILEINQKYPPSWWNNPGVTGGVVPDRSAGGKPQATQNPHSLSPELPEFAYATPVTVLLTPVSHKT